MASVFIRVICFFYDYAMLLLRSLYTTSSSRHRIFHHQRFPFPSVMFGCYVHVFNSLSVQEDSSSLR